MKSKVNSFFGTNHLVLRYALCQRCQFRLFFWLKINLICRNRGTLRIGEELDHIEIQFEAHEGSKSKKVRK